MKQTNNDLTKCVHYLATNRVVLINQTKNDKKKTKKYLAEKAKKL